MLKTILSITFIHFIYIWQRESSIFPENGIVYMVDIARNGPSHSEYKYIVSQKLT